MEAAGDTSQGPFTATVRGPLLGQASVCEPILRSLPEWFGIESAIVEYVRAIDRLPTFVAEVDGAPAAFLTLRPTSEYAAEIHVMAVRREAHRHGLGRALVGAAEAHLRAQGTEFLQVKTLAESDPDANYAATRAFYAAMGFRPLEEIRQIWGEENPCQIMVKTVPPSD
jgi:GNAT superfamily N-acetyltransferase